MWNFLPIISVVDPLLKKVIQNFDNFIDFSDGKKCQIDLTIWVLLDFLWKFVPVIYLLSTFKIVLRQSTISFIWLFGWQKLLNRFNNSQISKLTSYKILSLIFGCPFGFSFELYLALSNRIKFLDSRNYWIDLIIFVFLAFLCEFVPPTCFLSNFEINFKCATNFDQSFWKQKLLNWFNNLESRNWILIKFCPTL